MMATDRSLCGRPEKETVMSPPDLIRPARMTLAIAAMIALPGPASAQTAIKFSLDFKLEGPSAPFAVALDRGYYKAEGLDVSIDAGSDPLDPITRVAARTHEMGFGDINT